MEVTTGGRVAKHININGIKFFFEGSKAESVALAIRTLVQRTRSEPLPVGQSPQQIQQIVNDNVPSQAPLIPNNTPTNVLF
ncbi:MAG: hypothetical protein EU536_01740 [Promethearchaeota archaeon]|nr:MAG: hypothetical protein EU536_01740 [Candidatus Lokiarchaeota archaeon]